MYKIGTKIFHSLHFIFFKVNKFTFLNKTLINLLIFIEKIDFVLKLLQRLLFLKFLDVYLYYKITLDLMIKCNLKSTRHIRS